MKEETKKRRFKYATFKPSNTLMYLIKLKEKLLLLVSLTDIIIP